MKKMYVAEPPFINIMQALSVQILYQMMMSTQRVKNTKLGAVTTAVRNITQSFCSQRVHHLSPSWTFEEFKSQQKTRYKTIFLSQVKISGQIINALRNMHEEVIVYYASQRNLFPEVIPCFSSWQYNYYFAKAKIFNISLATLNQREGINTVLSPPSGDQ